MIFYWSFLFIFQKGMISTKLEESNYRIIILGDKGVGKTSLIKRHSTGDFTEEYVTTKGNNMHSLKIQTNSGLVTLNIWDLELLDTAKNCLADAFIIMFDVTNQDSYKNVNKWYQAAKLDNKNAPIVLCGNKVDRKNRHVSSESINFHREHKLQYYDISAKSNFNFEKPFLSILRELKKSDTLQFVDIQISL